LKRDGKNMIGDRRLCIVINKQGATLRPSESFLEAHIARLSGTVLPILGTPTVRRIGLASKAYVLRQDVPFRGGRWLARKTGLTTLSRQETRSMANYLRKQRVDVVMAEYGPTGIDIMAACKLAAVPLVTHFHGWDAYVLASDPARSPEYQALFQASEAIVAVSRHMQAHLRGLGAPPDRIVWNPCGAELRATAQARPAQAPPTFITVGRPAPKKATIVSLLAFAEVLRAIPEARLEMIGGGLDAVSYQAARALHIEHAVSFVGALPHEAVLERLCRARCYLHPSVTAPDGDMEGTPVTVMEAMAAGLPVVSTRHGGIMDLLEGTSAGVLVDEYDVEATAQAMVLYARDASRAQSDGAEGRRLMEEKWSMEHSIRKLDAIIELARARDSGGIALLAQDPAVNLPPAVTPRG
jgi:colanic acid/amylovoran biosynthesis glycosyltransferase